MNTTPLAHFETECIEPYEAMICIIIAIVVEIVGNSLLILVVVFDIAFGLVHINSIFQRRFQKPLKITNYQPPFAILLIS